MNSNKTKIVATLGPASSSKEKICQLIEAGVNVFRLNFSHGSHEQHKQTYDFIREASNEMNAIIGVLGDLQGPKIRVGKFKNTSVELQQNQDFILRCDKTEELGDEKSVSVSYKKLCQDVNVGDQLLFDDGRLKVKVKAIKDQHIFTTVLVGGILSNNKGINVPSADLSVDALTNKDISDLEFASKLGVDWVALSFVRKAEDLLLARSYMKIYNCEAKLMAKIEKPSAIKNFDSILKQVDGIMVARGDLGVELSPQQVPMLQKTLIRKTRIAGKPVITATQMLETMTESPVPTRAEASDVANAIFDGTDAVMLSAETAVGEHPLKAVRMMKTIADSVETDEEYIQRMTERKMTVLEENTPDAVSLAACQIATNLKAKVLVCFSSSGATALRVARNRIQANIIATSPNLKSCRQLALSWGVTPVISSDAHDTNEMVEIAENIIKQQQAAELGDTFIVTAGVPFGLSGTTNLIRVEVLKE